MRRFAAFLMLVALAFIAAACSGDGEPTAKTDPGNPSATQNDGAAQAAIEVEITADGFNPASAEVTVGQGINFNNNDSKPHTIIVPAGDEHVVEAGETFNFNDEGCCAATFTDKETGAEFKVTVDDQL
jgi:plastocyanin